MMGMVMGIGHMTRMLGRLSAVGVLDQEARDGLGVRGRMEAVLDWAKVRGCRTGETPARWRGHLDHLLPAKAKVRKVEHLAALPYARIGTFLAALRKQDGISARALEFLVLTATRTGETLGAT